MLASRLSLIELLAALLDREIVVVCGLPAVGKSDLLARLAARCDALGHPVSLLLWDSIRIRVESVCGTSGRDQATEEVRRLAGAWSRGAIGRWARERAPGSRMMVEAPLIGGRLSELAQPQDDDAEALLARALFVVPVPSVDLRRQMIHERHETHERGNGPTPVDAPARVIASLWTEMRAAARALAIDDSPDYSPALYAGVYQYALRHRDIRILDVVRLDDPRPASADPSEHIPSHPEVRALMSVVTGAHTLRAVWYAP